MGSQLPGLPTDALASYHFSIEIDGVQVAQFQEVSGLTSEIDVIQLKENTKDGKYLVHMLPGNPKPPTITLKRAKSSSMDLYNWHQQIHGGNVPGARKNGSVVLYSYDHTEVGRYNFVNAWPSKLSMSTLKSSGNEILMEECTIVCEELTRVK